MNSDIRLSIGFLDHPKTVKLQRQLGEAGVLSLLRLWLWSAQNRPSGILIGMDEDDIEIAARWEGEKGAFNAVATRLRFLDTLEGTYRIHNWTERNTWQSDAERRSGASRMARMAKTRPDLYKLLEHAGIKSISRESYEELTASEHPCKVVERLATGASSPLLSSPDLTSPSPAFPSDTIPFPSSLTNRADAQPVEEEKERKAELPVDSEPYRLAKLMRDTLKANVPTLREPDLQVWAQSLDDALNFDESMNDPAMVERVIRWACADRFWKAHIQSPRKLREKFDQLTARMASEEECGRNWKSSAQRRVEENLSAAIEAERLLFGDEDVDDQS